MTLIGALAVAVEEAEKLGLDRRSFERFYRSAPPHRWLLPALDGRLFPPAPGVLPALAPRHHRCPPVGAGVRSERERTWRETVTLIWFVIWLIADVLGNPAPLVFDPVNWWVGTLLLAIALDLGSQHARRPGKPDKG